jgi:hypothetical protein
MEMEDRTKAMTTLEKIPKGNPGQHRRDPA